MARRNPYSRNRKPSSGRIIALLVLLCLVILVIVQISTSPPPSDALTQENLDRAMLAHSNPSGAQTLENEPVTTDPPAVPSTQNTNPTTPPRNATPPVIRTPPPETTSQRNSNNQNQLTTNTQQTTQARQSTQVQQSTLPVRPVVTQPPAQQPVIANDTATKAYTSGKTAFEAHNMIAARDRLSEAVNLGLNNNLDQSARQMLNEATNLWLFSRTLFPGDELCTRHPIASGESLAVIGPKYLIPHEFISRINQISDPSRIRAGQALKVVQGPFHGKVELSKFRLTVYLGEVVVRTYAISIGMPDRKTPTGLWQVKLKQSNPSWTDPDTNQVYQPDDPDNPLGERWIALEGLAGDALGRTGFGIHGTIKPDEIGRPASRGCIRLFNGEVRELYDMLVPGRSQIWVVE